LRVWKRVDSQLDVEILSGGVASRATILDITPFGAGLTGSRQVEIGQPVSLRLAGSESVAGIVRWVSGVRFGIEFLIPLQDNEAFLVACGWEPQAGDRRLSASTGAGAGAAGTAGAAGWRGSLTARIRRLLVGMERRRIIRAQRRHERIIERAVRRQGMA
jgi:hypothetical protein